ncbi:bifunctional methylenetetrahydrofolate dehydrogenase/methenyltetrahydrofolate cyclohydrolase FolD [Niameybacter massiliensis]|uniref:bifunctional methylenetetrahydrofolate dehydrogenase/methenyltetrahydrofolate cyclohydrolase FolD n=1 Tax=Niameybacter massiliensis TaxID=1658108 RepID=UPI0006B43FF1|nr:bifunctional methylenetetrahydrofolate dehydrogenase/methenyltetrahydrofolate cyclohydrolase FolD [Niameybacter massiliensis]
METKIIDGALISTQIKDELKEQVLVLQDQGIYPGLAVVLVGENSASKVYVGNKKKACEHVGIKSFSYELPEETSEESLLELIETLNADENVHGILVQLPLPRHMDEQKVIATIAPYKDVDGFHVANTGALLVGAPGFVSCTPAGIMELLKRYDVELTGKKCVVVGRSNIVGKPISLLLLRENATVTMCHSKTKNLQEEIKQADVLVVAVGVAKMVTGDMLKEGCVVIDVGMNRDENGKLCGDVDFASCEGIASLMTPVPRGVGPMTIAMLMHNCVQAAMRKEK